MKKLLCIVPATYEELYAKGVDFGILMRDLNGYWDEVITVHPFCKDRREIKLSDRHTVLEFKKWDLRIIPQLVKIIRQRNITAIKAHDPFLCGLLGRVLSMLCRIPYVIFVCASYDLVKPILGLRLVDKVVNRIAMRGASMVFVGTEPARRLVLSMGAKADKIRQVRSANVWTGHFDGERSRRKRNNTVLFIGRLSTEKYVSDVIEAFSVISASVPRAELHIYGEGDVDIRPQIEELGLTGKVKLFGFQPQDTVRQALLTASAILIPLGGNVLVEACLARTPIVAYDIDWHSELIEYDKSGLLTTFRNWHTMGEMAIRLLQDRKLATRLGREARVRALAQRSPEFLYKVEAQAFEEIIGR